MIARAASASFEKVVAASLVTCGHKSMECRWSLSWRHAFRECEDMTPTTTIVSALKRGVLPWTQMPVSTCVATFIVLSCVHKAVYTWAHRPRRRDGKQYGSYGSNLDECPSTPDSSYAILASDIGDDYQLSRPKSLARIQIAKAQEEEHLFSLLAVLMRQVAFGFTCKALVHAVLTTYTAHREGISALPAFFDSTDEL